MEPNQTTQTQPADTGERLPLHLPVGVVSTADARRLRRDVAAMQDTLQAIRIQTNSPVSKLPRLSRALEEFAGTNRLNFLLPEDRHQAEIFLDYVLTRAPVMHISFASEASRKFTTELVLWLRANYDSEMLVEIGLEPNMAAGSVVRTTNKVFDFSLSEHLTSKRDMLMEMILQAPPAEVSDIELPQLTVATPPVAAPTPVQTVTQQPVPQLVRSAPAVVQPAPAPAPTPSDESSAQAAPAAPAPAPTDFVPPPPIKPLGGGQA